MTHYHSIVPKFPLHSMVEVRDQQGWTGKVIFVELAATGHRYLLDCWPGACGGYAWYIHPDGYGDHKQIAANWFNECELEAFPEESE